ncbi:MAG: MarR family transcriptional regulator [Clostridiales bacterium]|jgi:DNA-binding MarR family transcriptional regulator|nr:MarR family transcriptional regulator [Clostridiales bacterium]
MENQSEIAMRALKENLMRSIFRFKKVGVAVPQGESGGELEDLDISPSELFCMKSFSENSLESEKNVCSTDMQNLLYITKPAISRILTSLEEKGYVEREINKRNRRKLTVTLTDKGAETLRRAEKKVDEALSEVIRRFGESETLQFIEIFNRFADIADEVSGKFLQTNHGQLKKS